MTASTTASGALRVRYLQELLDKNQPEQLVRWAASPDALQLVHWGQLHEAWQRSTNKGCLSWPVLNSCIQAAAKAATSGSEQALKAACLQQLGMFTSMTASIASEKSWAASLDDVAAHACIEQAVSWRLQQDTGDSYAFQCLQTTTLMDLCLQTRQGRIWRDHFQLYTYPLVFEQVLALTESNRCEEPAVYHAIWFYLQNELTHRGWKRACAQQNQWHNLAQISSSPYLATEYILDRHAEHDNRSSYSQLVEDIHTLFPRIEATDVWMLEQLACPSGSWEASACPEPDNKSVQAWWYSMLLGASSVELKEMLSMASPAPAMALDLPSDLLAPS